MFDVCLTIFNNNQILIYKISHRLNLTYSWTQHIYGCPTVAIRTKETRVDVCCQHFKFYFIFQVILEVLGLNVKSVEIWLQKVEGHLTVSGYAFRVSFRYGETRSCQMMSQKFTKNKHFFSWKISSDLKYPDLDRLQILLSQNTIYFH